MEPPVFYFKNEDVLLTETLQMTDVRIANPVALFEGSALEFALSDFRHVMGQNPADGIFYLDGLKHGALPNHYESF